MEEKNNNIRCCDCIYSMDMMSGEGELIAKLLEDIVEFIMNVLNVNILKIKRSSVI